MSDNRPGDGPGAFPAANLLLFADDHNSGHDPGPGMPDRPERVAVALAAVRKAGLEFELRQPEPASDRSLLRAHKAGYLERLKTFSARGGGWIDADTAAGPDSFSVAVRAAGACCEAADAALGGTMAFCLTRPPGHHATSDQAMGFCLINNVAVGAAHALDAGLDKVMILDIDVHHGNGTQEIFWSDSRVLYVSLHQWPWYPWTTGGLEEIGGGNAEGSNVNIPLPEGCGDDVYERALGSIAAPVARQFEPQLVMVSAGFDAHAADHLSLQQVSSAGFGRIASAVRDLAEEVCGGRLVMTLEGGYNLGALAESVVETTLAMTGRGPIRRNNAPPDGAPPEVLQPIVAFHAARWGLSG